MSEQEIQTLIERIKDELVQVGSIMCYAASKCPRGYLPCDGRELVQSQYPDLYKIIGKTFGGGQKTFCVPNLQGRFIRGWDEDGDVDSGRKFGEPQEDAIQGHSHELELSSRTTLSAGSHNHEILADGRKTLSGESHERGVISTKFYDLQGGKTTTNGSHTHSLPDIKIKEPSNSTYGSICGKVDTETRPKNVALLYCIKVR